MNQITCPNCETAFKVDEAGFAAILKQVRDRQFEKELQNTLNTAVQLAEANLRNTLQAALNKKDNELSCAIASGVTLNMESKQEMERIAILGQHLGICPKVAIRVNPNFELKSSGMKRSGGAKQFGVDAERVPSMLARMHGLKLNSEGFHIFCGSQNLNAAAIQEAQEKTIQLGLSLAKQASCSIRLLNIGGGFGIPYFPGDKELDLKSVCKNLHHLINETKKHAPNTRIEIELGRYIVAESGI